MEPDLTDLLPRDFLDRPSTEVAPDLLGCVLEHESAEGLVAVTLTEVEAYAGAVDPASHAYRGRTTRNAVMFGPAGHAYVYFTYGMHFCVNVVCMPPGTASAVLLRAGKVTAGEELAQHRRSPASQRGAPPDDRGARSLGDERREKRAGSGAPEASGASRARDLARGPARLCQALGIDRALDGADLCAPDSRLRLRGRASTTRSGEKSLILTGPRVGVREGADVSWRFWLDGEPTVSAFRPYYRKPPTRKPLPPTTTRWHHANVDDVIAELDWRGLIGQSTDLGELRNALASGPVTFYAGFDPTGPGLHIGHLALMLTMRRLQHAGHRPIGVVGGATGLIGDPSGKSAERTLNAPEVVAGWVARIRGEVGRFIDLSAGALGRAGRSPAVPDLAGNLGFAAGGRPAGADPCHGAAACGGSAGGRPDGSGRDRAHAVRGPARHRRGRRVPEQPAGGGSGRRRDGKRPVVRSLPGPAPGKAHRRGC